MVPTSPKNCAKFLTVAIFENELGPSQRVFFFAQFFKKFAKKVLKRKKKKKKI
jgi:hypothetical protein